MSAEVPEVRLSAEHRIVEASDENLALLTTAALMAAFERGVAECAAALRRDAPDLQNPYDPRPCQHDATRLDRATGVRTCLDCGERGVGGFALAEGS